MTDQSPVEHNPLLDELSGFVTYRISRLHGKLNAQASRILNDLVGITLNQWRMIAFIGVAETMTASELVKYTAMDKGLVSRNVKSLIELGLVVSTNDESDSRVHILQLTPKGKTVFDVALPRMQRRQAGLKKNLNADDLAAFYRVVDCLEAAAEDVTP